MKDSTSLGVCSCECHTFKDSTNRLNQKLADTPYYVYVPCKICGTKCKECKGCKQMLNKQSEHNPHCQLLKKFYESLEIDKQRIQSQFEKALAGRRTKGLK